MISMIETVSTLFLLIQFYLLLGVIFSVYFYFRGAFKLDVGTKNTPWHFKVIIFPGVIVFWCFLLFRLIKK